MAEKRMFSKKITNSDAFLEMPVTARLLYYDLNMEADDDGFVGNPKGIMRMTGARDDDMRILLEKKFIIYFECGVIVIKHWRIHNTIKNDRYKPTVYQEEFSSLIIKENKAYTQTVQNVSSLEPQNRIEEIKLEEINKKEINKEKAEPTTTTRFKKPTIEEISLYCLERKNTINPQRFFDYYEANGWKVGKNPMKDWKAAVRTWEGKESQKYKKDNASFDIDKLEYENMRNTPQIGGQDGRDSEISSKVQRPTLGRVL